MNEPLQPPPPPGAPAVKKKGLPTLAWVGIGCAGLLLVAAVVVAIGLSFAAKKIKDTAADFQDNPGMATAEMVVRMNPELELVDSDREKGTLTIRDKKSGEEVTVNFEDVEQGKLGFKSGDKETTFTFGQGEGKEGVQISAEGDDGTTQMKIGGGTSSEDLPDWVPVYPGTSPVTAFLTTGSDGTSGAFSMNTSDSPEKVLAYYAEALSDLGGEPRRSTFSSGDTQGGSVSTSSADGNREINVSTVGTPDGTTITITFSDKP